jgi:acyl dehydratase
MLPPPGEDIYLGKWVVDRTYLEEYLSASEDNLPLYEEIGAAPPMALGARAVGSLVRELSLPPGTLHASQELDCHRMVRLGEEVSCTARLSRPVKRRGWLFVTASFTIYGADGELVLTGRSAVSLPPADGLEGE